MKPSFGANAEINPRNIIDTKQFEVRTPDVTIRVNPERRDLVETRIIDGAKYILIRADEGVEVNGCEHSYFEVTVYSIPGDDGELVCLSSPAEGGGRQTVSFAILHGIAVVLYT